MASSHAVGDDEATLRVEIRLKNARLLDAIHTYPLPLLKARPQAQGRQRQGPIHAFCRLHVLTYETVLGLISLRQPPHDARTGQPRKVVHRLCAIFDKPVTWLFPADLYHLAWPRLLATDIAPEQFMPLADAPTSALLLPPTQEQSVLDQELHALVDQALKTLTPREALVVRARFGLNGDAPESLRSIGKWLPRSSNAEIDPGGVGVQCERVRQIEAKALRKLRHPSRSRALRPFMEE